MNGSGVLLVGDVIDDVVVRPAGPIAADTDTPSRIERTAGGSAANTACWLGTAGVPATLVATVHADDLARHAALLERAGARPVLTSSTRPTGTIVILSQGDHRAMLTDRGANEETGPQLVGDELLSAHAHLHLAGHVLAGTDRDAAWRALLGRAAAAGVTSSIAAGSAAMLAAYGAERFRRLVAGAELLVASREEAQLLTGLDDPEAAARALGGDHAQVVVTLGSDGAVVAGGGGATRVPAASREPVDVTGAGDAFLAGLLAARLDGAAPAESAAAGARLAARAVAQVGGRPR